MTTRLRPEPLAHTCQECGTPAAELYWHYPTTAEAGRKVCEVCWYVNGTPVRDHLAAAGAADAPAALVAHLATKYRTNAREHGQGYALDQLRIDVDAWKINRAEHGPRATWSRERGHHAATISTIIEDVTR